MKTAVCMSGLPRDILETYRSQITYLLDCLPEPDLFIHTSETFPDEFFAQTRCCSYVVEEQHRFPHLEEVLQRVGYHIMDHANSYLQQIHGYKRVWQTKLDYEQKTGTKYDLAVRVRPDLIFFKPLPKEFLQTDAITVFDDPQYMGTEFAAGDDGLMAHYFTIFDWLAERGEAWLTTDRRRHHGMYNCDLIMRAYLLDDRQVPVRGLHANPYEYYRIFRLHQMGVYG